MCVRGETISPYDVLKFAQVNAQTVYKICKRLTKRCKSDAAVKWLIQVRTNHVYSFMGGNTTTHLQLKLSGHAECPICMEDIHPDKDHKMLVFGCGHFGCLNCVLRYAGVNDMKGTWFNLLACANKKDCPVCRDNMAFNNAICIKEK
jgi:hypothetical protein